MYDFWSDAYSNVHWFDGVVWFFCLFVNCFNFHIFCQPLRELRLPCYIAYLPVLHLCCMFHFSDDERNDDDDDGVRKKTFFFLIEGKLNVCMLVRDERLLQLGVTFSFDAQLRPQHLRSNT